MVDARGRPALILACALTALSAAACGGDDRRVLGDGGVGIPRDTGAPGFDGGPEGRAAMVLTRAYCEKLFACCTETERIDEIGFFDPDPTNADECVAVLGGAIAREAASIAARAGEGRLTFTPERAEACAAAIDAVACADWNIEGDLFGDDMIDDPACADLVIALGPVGAPCNAERECISASCHDAERMCLEAGAVGDPCVDHFGCGEHLRCQHELPAPTCGPRFAAGEACLNRFDCRSGTCENPASPGLCSSNCECIPKCDGP